MKPGQSIQIQLTDERARPLRIDNIVVQVEFFTKGNYRYGFEAGRTDENGRLIVSYDDVEKQRHKSSMKNLMDHNTKLEECDPTVRLTILTEQELRLKRQKVGQFYEKEPDWAAIWPSNAYIEAEATKVELSSETVSVEIRARKI
jgi:hypothetical protein